ncbi:MAG: hypothetical protein MJ102_00110 [Clostridia bacterium]|nr:hypothetical protein [Clostridia bacterium]
MSSKNDDFLGGLFDLDGDGKTSLDEEYIAYKIFEETTNEELDDDPDDDDLDDDDIEDIESDIVPTYHTVPKAAPVVKSSPSTIPTVSVPSKLTKENYPNLRNASRFSIAISIIIGLVISLIPGLVMWATVESYDDKNTAYWFVFLLFFGGGLVVLGIIWSTVIKLISEECNKLHDLKENYLKLLSEEELSAIRKKKRNSGIITACIFGAVIAGLITISAVNTSKLANAYDKAVSLVDIGSYKEAKELFEEIEEKNYHDTSAYILLCEAHIDYERGYISSAYYDMNKVRFSYLSSEQDKVVNDFVKTLKAEYDVYLKEKSEADAKAYRDRITYGVPYVGMSESEIKNTSLGAPSSNVRHNSEMINGERYIANLYDFKSGNKTIFTARCVKGRVTEVWDHRSDPVVPYTPKKNTKSKSDDDPYDVNDYSNEEDFYYDHYDDFFDYYDAEDYYNEHHK